jgi:hypothetical protein
MNRIDFEDLPDLPLLEDEVAAHLSEFFYELAVVVENHYYDQIQRYHKHIRSLQRDATLRSLHHLNEEKNANTEEDIDMQDDELDF